MSKSLLSLILPVRSRTEPGKGRRTWGITVVTAAIVLASGVTMAWAAGFTVSQQDRIFHPDRLSIAVGGTVQFVNDDGQLLHHAYVHTPEFSFDSGEQEPGSRMNVVFPVAGTFTVLCAIHPKMQLVVTVK